MADDYGYLWIGTSKGVVRYNGYNTKLYNYASGLPEEDIWRFYRDKRKRLWLSAISNQLGYIANNRYRRIVNLSGRTLYPSQIGEYDKGIYFISPYINQEDYALWIEQNDTLFSKHAAGLDNAEHCHYLTDGRNIIFFKNDNCYVAPIDFSVRKDTLHFSPSVQVRHCKKVSLTTDIIGNSIFSAFKNSSTIDIINYRRKTQKTIDLVKEAGATGSIQRLAIYNDSYGQHAMVSAITQNEVYIADSNFVFVKQGSFDSLFGYKNAGTSASFFIFDSLWRKCLSTTSGGVFIHYEQPNRFVKTPLNLKEYKYVGGVPDKNTYWWHDDNKILLELNGDKITARHELKNIRALQHIIPYGQDSFFFLCSEYMYLMQNKPFRLLPFWNPATAPSIGGYNLVLLNSGRFYLVSKTLGLTRFASNNLSTRNDLNRERFSDIVYDPVRSQLLVYKNDDIEIYDHNKLLHSLPGDSLAALKITNVEKICTDSKYGNIFLKEYDRLLVFTGNIHHYKTLLSNYMLNDAVICVYKNTLVAAGRFGILFCKIKGPYNFSAPLLYPNIKYQAYNYVTDIQASAGKLLLNTDKGTYAIAMPADSVLDAAQPPNPDYRIILSYNDSLRLVRPNDTIACQQNNPGLQFDLVNPTGTGTPQFEYYISGIDSNWHTANANQLVLPGLNPGRYYRMAIRVHDDAWRSNILYTQLYTIPYWWQKSTWQRSFYAAGILLFLLFVYSVVLITRKMVIRNNRKKTLQLELELQAIYSQINPHFIYNTLNSALLLINNNNMQEAYTHVSKFSKLLRAYVRSSRNKYITVKDEIDNLKHYIELQQTRFKNKFGYTILLDKELGDGSIKIPALLVQPFVENAINHGLLHKEGTGHLAIHFSKGAAAGELVCTIEDDGIGREKSRKLHDTDVKHESYGNELIKTLVDIFRHHEQLQIEVAYTDKQKPLSGTIVKIIIKYPKHDQPFSVHHSG